MEACRLLAARSSGDGEVFGGTSLRQVQLCPQTQDVLGEGVVDALRAAWPATRFRLHANLSVHPGRPPRLDASTVCAETWPYYRRLAALSRRLEAPLYSLHAGRRRHCRLADLPDRVCALRDLFEVPVAIEGMYPAPGEAFLVSSADEYRWLLDSGLDYALDMSHLHILATQEGPLDAAMVRALLSSPHCLEIHLSHNDGRSDQHRALTTADVWWWRLLAEAHPLSPHTVLFSEGRLPLRPAKSRA